MSQKSLMIKKTTKPRSYDNRHRSKKSKLNRQQIIETYIDMLAEASGLEVSLQDLALKSNVSSRTLFRFFGDKGSLNLELETYLGVQSSMLSSEMKKMNFADYAAFTYITFDKYERLFKAYLFTEFGQKSRLIFKKKFNDLLLTKIKSEIDFKPSKRQTLRIQFMVNMISVHLWSDLKMNAGISGKDISEAVSWSMNTLLKGLKL